MRGLTVPSAGIRLSPSCEIAPKRGQRVRWPVLRAYLGALTCVHWSWAAFRSSQWPSFAVAVSVGIGCVLYIIDQRVS